MTIFLNYELVVLQQIITCRQIRQQTLLRVHLRRIDLRGSNNSSNLIIKLRPKKSLIDI